jgi:glycosyl transferase family 25
MDIRSLPIFVMHYKPAVRRRQILGTALDDMKLKVRWVTDWDAEDLTPADLAHYYQDSGARWAEKMDWQGGHERRRLKTAEISLGIKFLKSMKAVVDERFTHALFLEDDAIFADNFCARFDQYFQNAPGDSDFTFLGCANGLRDRAVVPDVHFYLQTGQGTKGTDSFVISRRACMAALACSAPFTLMFDWELNWLMHSEALKVYWLEPPLVRQGSEIGLYPTHIR